MLFVAPDLTDVELILLDLTQNAAAGDLRRLVDAGLLVQQGRGRGAHYISGPRLRAATTTVTAVVDEA